jgi:hypothetical protein
MLQLCLGTQIADADVTGYLQPPIVACYKLQGLEAACMSGDACITVLFNDTVPKAFVIGHIDPTMKHE